MKKLIASVVLAAAAASPAISAPFMAIGDGAEIFVTGVLSISADDNVLLTGNKTDDLVFLVTPGAELTFGKDGQLKGSLSANVAFTSYADNSRLNTTLFGSDFRSNYDDGKMKLNFTMGYHEANQNSADVSGLTRRDVFTAGGGAEIETSQLLSVSAGVDFSHENYKKKGYTDSDNMTVPLNVYYKMSPKVDMSFGYRYRDYRVDIGQDSKDHYFNIGARGEFTPKLSGKFTVGFNNRKFSNGNDESDPGFDADLTYTITEKTSLQLGGSKDFSTTPQGQQQRNTSVRTAISSKLNEQWSVNADLSYRNIEYTNRTDGFFEGGIGANYVFDANISFNGGFRHRVNSSGAPGGDFTNNVFSIAANIRY